MAGVRRMYWCEQCVAARAKDPNLTIDRRVINEGDPVPRCPKHGAMQRQRNKAYLGEAVPE